MRQFSLKHQLQENLAIGPADMANFGCMALSR
jgi:hypothetical protein